MERRRVREQHAPQRLSAPFIAERAAKSDPALAEVADTTDSTATRASFCRYLTSAREASGKSIQEIATITRIPTRSLERLEDGAFEDLPGDVFVRGFLRSYARCVGLNEEDAVKRYARCGMTPAPVASPMADELAGTMATLESSPAAGYRAVRVTRPDTNRRDRSAESMPAAPAAEPSAVADSLPVTVSGAAGVATDVDQSQASRAEVSSSEAARTAEAQPVNAPEPASSNGSRSARSKKRRRRNRKAQTPVPTPVMSPVTIGAPAAETVETAMLDASDDIPTSTSMRAATPAIATAPVQDDTEPSDHDTTRAVDDTSVRVQSEESTMAPAPVANPGVASGIRARAATPAPVIFIDDDCPEQAESEREARVAREREDNTWKTFLPPALLDSDEGSHRGALTLAVIILVIVATLTMSYLLRRPSHSGDGVTLLEEPALHTPRHQLLG